MPKKPRKSRRAKTAKSSKTAFVRPLTYTDSGVILYALNAVRITGASAEELARVKSEVRRVSIAPTPEELMAQQRVEAAMKEQAAKRAAEQ